MHRSRLSFALFVTAALGLSLFAFAQSVPPDQGPPTTIPYQGRLELGGLPQTGPHTLQFFVVDDAANGLNEALWTETHDAVSIRQGAFAVELGSIDPFPEDTFTRGALFLGVVVDGTELSGLQRLSRTPYTVEAVNGVPPGMVMPFAGVSPPLGWLICDGSVHAIADFPRLAAVLGNLYGGNGTSTFALPQMLDRYAMGGGAGGTSVGTSLGNNSTDHVHDSGDLGAHIGLTWTASESNRFKIDRRAGSSFVADQWVPAGIFNGGSGAQAPKTVVSGNTGMTSVDNRPESLALLYVIKW